VPVPVPDNVPAAASYPTEEINPVAADGVQLNTSPADFTPMVTVAEDNCAEDPVTDNPDASTTGASPTR
jgi:hypothetical protein